MSDLISRSMYKSKLLKALDVLNKEYREAILNEDNDLILAIQNQQSAYMIALRLLDNEPTAYNIDKVVEELKEAMQDLSVIEILSHIDFDSTIQNSLENFLKAITNEAIEIVKQEAEQYQSSEIGFISKTEVLTLIEEIKCNDDIPKNYGTLLDIMRMIRNMPTVDNTDNGWILCSERLPEESGYYLVTYHNWSDGNFLPKYNDTYVRRLHYQISEHFVGWNYPKNVDDRAENDCHKEVIAWQPLPEPFKERD